MVKASYTVESYLAPLVRGIRETLAEHCENGERVVYLSRGIICRFEVSTEKKADGSVPVVRAKGVIARGGFEFRSGGDGAVFSCTFYDDAEDMFHQFALIMSSFRGPAGYRPAYLDGLYDIDPAGLSPAGPAGYAPYKRADDIQYLLGKRLAGLCVREVCGKFTVIVYSENSRATAGFRAENIPVYRRLLDEFKGVCGVTDATLLYVRAGARGFAFFYAEGRGFFYNTGDGGAAFLKRESAHIAGLLRLALERVTGGAKRPAAEHGYEYRAAADGGYTLYVDGRRTEMRISMSVVLKGSKSAPGISKDLGLIAFAEGGKKTMRQYKSLEDAFEGELELALGMSGDADTFQSIFT
jgi:hypothetical protein